MYSNRREQHETVSNFYVCCYIHQVNRFMVTKPPTGVPRLKSSLANTSVSSCDSESSAASTASAAPRLTTTRAAATSTPAATDHGGVKVARAKSFNPASRPPPVTRRTRPSIGITAPSPNPNTAEAKPAPAVKLVSQATLKRRLSVAASSKSVSVVTAPSSSAAAASKPPLGQIRKPLKGASAGAAVDSKAIRKNWSTSLLHWSASLWCSSTVCF